MTTSINGRESKGLTHAIASDYQELSKTVRFIGVAAMVVEPLQNW